MKILPLLFGSLAASIALGGAAAQMSAPLEHYSLPPGYGASTNPPEGRSISPDRYPYHHSGTRGRLGRGANPRHPEVLATLEASGLATAWSAREIHAASARSR